MTTDFPQVVRDALQTLNASTESSLRRELSTSFGLGHSERLQFEIDPVYYGIHLIQTEETVLDGDAVYDLVPFDILNAVEESGVDPFAVIADEIVAWFADRWRAADGPKHYSPAYAFFHGGLDSPRYDLEHKRWHSVQEVWPDD